MPPWKRKHIWLQTTSFWNSDKTSTQTSSFFGGSSRSFSGLLTTNRGMMIIQRPWLKYFWATFRGLFWWSCWDIYGFKWPTNWKDQVGSLERNWYVKCKLSNHGPMDKLGYVTNGLNRISSDVAGHFIGWNGQLIWLFSSITMSCMILSINNTSITL